MHYGSDPELVETSRSVNLHGLWIRPCMREEDASDPKKNKLVKHYWKTCRSGVTTV